MPKKKSAANLSNQEAGSEVPKRPTILGTDQALSLPTARGTSLQLSYWDFWFALVAVMMHDGHLDRLAKRIKDERGIYYDRDSIERKRWHLRDLERRLTEVSVTPTEIVRAAGDLVKKEKRRAFTRVMESSGRGSDWSEPMQNTPRRQRVPRALRGYWDRFPVSPQPYEKKIAAHFQAKSFYSEDMSIRVARILDQYVDNAKSLVEKGEAAQAQALLRGWMTMIIQLMEKVDDSYGSIGMSFGNGFKTYLEIPFEQTGIDEAVFFPDLLDFLIWENYGLTDKAIVGFFRGLNQSQADLCVEHLRQEITALLDDDLECESAEALTLLGQAVAEQERFDEFEAVARQMGSRAWRPIVRLADIAMRRRQEPLAMKVLEAAMTKGDHLDLLTKKYEKLKLGHWSPDPIA